MKADVIKVWYCENCGSYELNFNVDIANKFYCKFCGYEMKPRRYREVVND